MNWYVYHDTWDHLNGVLNESVVTGTNTEQIFWDDNLNITRMPEPDFMKLGMYICYAIRGNLNGLPHKSVSWVTTAL